MPELPEVKTTVDYLKRKVVGRKITAAWYDWAKLKPIEKAVGHTIKDIRRIGKNILFYLARRSRSEDESILLVHQKMTGHLLLGKWRVEGKKVVPIEPQAIKERVNDFIHFILTLSNGGMIGFSDLRKFGKAVFGSAGEIENSKELKQLGPDALEVSCGEFGRRVGSRSKTIYQTLMDQTVVSGIGNIYASEILFAAKVHPMKIAKNLTLEELRAICVAGKKILKLAFRLHGTSIADYRIPSGESGFYTDRRLVYQREGEPCPASCGSKIHRLKKGGRSAFYCPNCQKL